MGTKRVEKDPLFYKSDDHFEDGLTYNIPAKVKAEAEDETIVSEDEAALDPEEIERDKRKLRRTNQKNLILNTRRHDVEIKDIRKDLKPLLIACAVFNWIWTHIIGVALAAVGVTIMTAWLTGMFGTAEKEAAPAPVEAPAE